MNETALADSIATAQAQALADSLARADSAAAFAAIQETATSQMPPQASTIAGDVDALYYFIFWGCTVFFALIVGLTLFFIIKYRRREGEVLPRRADHNTPIEITWTVVPLILVMIVFVWGFRGYMSLSVAPGDSIDYYVTGKRWLWEITHPNGDVAINEMTVPVNKPVKIILTSADVIHSFFIPDFRVKCDAVPNRYSTLWFEALAPGDYQVFCTEYCGTGHSEMLATVHVLSEEKFESWLEESSGQREGESLEEYGGRLYAKKACITCHSLDGSGKTGPSFQGLYGRVEQLTDGSSVTADEDYLRSSILNPNSQIVAGYDGVMPSYAGTLKDDEILGLIAFIKSLQ